MLSDNLGRHINTWIIRWNWATLNLIMFFVIYVQGSVFHTSSGLCFSSTKSWFKFEFRVSIFGGPYRSVADYRRTSFELLHQVKLSIWTSSSFFIHVQRSVFHTLNRSFVFPRQIPKPCFKINFPVSVFGGLVLVCSWLTSELHLSSFMFLLIDVVLPVCSSCKNINFPGELMLHWHYAIP
jgi:hypothetical protein